MTQKPPCRARFRYGIGDIGFSLMILTKKVVTSVAFPPALLLLDVTGYVPDVTVPEPGALMGIRFTIRPIPAVLLALGIVFANKDPLDCERFASVVVELTERRAAARGTIDAQS